jgi:hypothetical protein
MAMHAPQLVPQVQVITHVFCNPTPFLRQPQDSVKVVPAPPQQAAALISGTTPLSSLSAKRAMILIQFTSFRWRTGAAGAAVNLVALALPAGGVRIVLARAARQRAVTGDHARLPRTDAVANAAAGLDKSLTGPGAASSGPDLRHDGAEQFVGEMPEHFHLNYLRPIYTNVRISCCQDSGAAFQAVGLADRRQFRQATCCAIGFYRLKGGDSYWPRRAAAAIPSVRNYAMTGSQPD